MGTQTSIAWTDSSWNPITGCSKVSSGCANCYAERLSLEKGWSDVPWTKRNARENVTLHPERLDHPLRWREPRKIFLCSMGDLFHELVPDDFIAKVFDVIARCPGHTFQLLTKRPARMAEFVSRYDPEDLAPSPLPNLWLGTSVENQAAAEARLPEASTVRGGFTVRVARASDRPGGPDHRRDPGGLLAGYPHRYSARAPLAAARRIPPKSNGSGG